MALIATLNRVAVLPPLRLGTRPRTHRALPHLQLDQLPPAETMEQLVELSRELPHVHSRQSRMASPRSYALYLADEFALGPPEAFIVDHEFCHLHPLPEGSIHLTLPSILREEVVRLGWGELHPIARAGILPALVTAYGPRDHLELEVVLGLIAQSCQFAQGSCRFFKGWMAACRSPGEQALGSLPLRPAAGFPAGPDPRSSCPDTSRLRFRSAT